MRKNKRLEIVSYAGEAGCASGIKSEASVLGALFERMTSHVANLNLKNNSNPTKI